MPKISVVIITYNEEKNIRRCLESVQDIADDIVIIDSYSTDRTKEICTQYKTRFIQHRFDGHIEQKNWAISKAKYPHILSLDADEALSEELSESISKIKNNWKYDGYYFNRLTNYCGKWIRHTSWYPAQKLRLWDSSKGVWGGVNPHDRYILKKGSSKHFLKGDLFHYSYYSIDEHIAQINKFSDITAEEKFRDGERASYSKMLLNPFWRFFRDYFIKVGFLDGFYGFVICLNSAHETFLKYVKLRQKIRDDINSKKHKVCFFNTARAWGGGEKWHYDISLRLSKKGYSPIIFTNKKSGLRERLKDTKIPMYFTTISNLSFLNIFKVWHIARILKKEQVKTIIINLSADFKVAGTAAKYADVKNIIYRRGSAIPIRDTSLNRFLYRKVATKIIANSKETYRTIFANNQYLVSKNKVVIIYNGIDINSTIENKQVYKRVNGEILIGNAGRLSEEKGHKYLFKMARLLKNKGIKFKLLLAGTGRLEHKYKKMVEHLDVQDEVKFLGFIDDIQDFNNTIDIFVLTSQWEGFGYVLVEAMAKCKPVVAFDIHSSSEIIDNNKTGFLVPKYDVKKLTKSVEKLINDADLRKQFGEKGIRTVEERFNIHTVIEEVEKLLI